MSGCMVGPNYTPPENTVSEEWIGTPENTSAVFTDADFNTAWWKVFEDKTLEKCIELAAYNNKTLMVAEANILRARAVRMVAAAPLFPQINADFNATKTYFSKNGPIFAASTFSQGVSPVTGLPFEVEVPQIQPLYNALFDATWEIDLFGKTRRGVEAADAKIDSAIAIRNDVLVSLLAEVAKNYIEIRSNQRQAELVEKNIQLFEKQAEITRISLEKGLDNQLDYENIQAQLETARSTLPNLIAQVFRGIYAISVLTGNLPETLLDELLPVQPLPKLPEEIAVGIRSDILRRRPDVRIAERVLAAATANVGVAVASFYPTITLSGDGGFQSLKIGNLFQMHSKTWSVGGDINLPVFQGGRLIGNLRANRAIAEGAAYAYQQTVLTAVQEAESSLVSYSEDLVTTHALAQVTERNRMLVKLAKERYEKGLVNLPSLLTSEQQLITAEISQLNSDTTALTDLIALYKALGGGWEPIEEEKEEAEKNKKSAPVVMDEVDVNGQDMD